MTNDSSAPNHEPMLGTEGESHLLHSVLGALVAAESLEEGLHAFLRDIREGLGADYGALWLALSDDEHLRSEAVSHAQAPELQTLAIVSRTITSLSRADLPGRAWVTGQS